MISNSGLGDAAIAIDAMPNSTSPMRITRMRPYTSLSDPATRMSDPSVIRYASTTHCWVAIPPPSSRMIAGRATFTTVPSRNETNDASTAIVRTSF